MVAGGTKPTQKKGDKRRHSKQDGSPCYGRQKEQNLPNKVLKGGSAAFVPHAAKLASLRNYAVK
jgi:hypothetical protein